MLPLAAGAGAPAALPGNGIVGPLGAVDVVGVVPVVPVVGVVGVVPVVGVVGVVGAAPGVTGAPDVFGFPAAGFDAVVGVVPGVPGVAPTPGLAPLAPAALAVAGCPVVEPDEVLFALHAQRLRAPIHRHMDESVPLLVLVFIRVLQ
jgi:hypothetical protein